MVNKSKLINLAKYFPNGKKDVDALLIEYNNDLDKLYEDATNDIKERLIANFYDPDYINSKSFGTLVNIFNEDKAPAKQLEIRDRNEAEFIKNYNK